MAAALQSRYHIAQRRTGVTGEASEVARELVDALAAEMKSHHARPRWPGWRADRDRRPTKGRGGPSQELALAAAIEFERRGIDEARVITFSTDGIDGPTGSTGGIGDTPLFTKSERWVVTPSPCLMNTTAPPHLNSRDVRLPEPANRART